MKRTSLFKFKKLDSRRVLITLQKGVGLKKISTTEYIAEAKP